MRLDTSALNLVSGLPDGESEHDSTFTRERASSVIPRESRGSSDGRRRTPPPELVQELRRRQDEFERQPSPLLTGRFTRPSSSSPSHRSEYGSRPPNDGRQRSPRRRSPTKSRSRSRSPTPFSDAEDYQEDDHSLLSVMRRRNEQLVLP